MGMKNEGNFMQGYSSKALALHVEEQFNQTIISAKPKFAAISATHLRNLAYLLEKHIAEGNKVVIKHMKIDKNYFCELAHKIDCLQPNIEFLAAVTD